MKQLVLAFILIALSGTAVAQNRLIPQAMQLDGRATFEELFTKAKARGLTIDVTLKSGAVFKGKIVEATAAYLILDQLSDRSYFGAVIKRDEIAAVVVRTKDG